MTKRSINQLDDIQLRRFIAAGAPVSKLDGAGLTFTLSKAGTASWVLRYMVNRKPRELTLGNYPDLSLAQARKMAREKRVDIDRGKDPAAEKASEKTRSMAAWTVRTLADDYQSRILVEPSFAPGTIYYRKWDLANVIKPKLGAMEVRNVSSLDIVHVLKASRRSWTIKKRILTSIKKLMDHAIGQQLIQVNPCEAIQLTALEGPRPEVKKRIMLTEQELKILLGTIDRIGPENALALKILLATCVRSVELARSTWEHVYLDRAVWWVPDTVVKTRTGFLVPLAPQVIKWFKELKNMAGDSKWVLPARVERRNRKHGCDAPVGGTTLWAAINRAFLRGDLEVRRFTPHDTRSTAKGHMRNLGVTREISELALNHTLKGMDAIYDVREEVPERREAMKLWSDFIEKCSQPEIPQPDAESPDPSTSDPLPSPT